VRAGHACGREAREREREREEGEYRSLMGLAVLELFLALVAVLEVHEVELVLLAGELGLVVLLIHSIVELAHPDGQGLTHDTQHKFSEVNALLHLLHRVTV